MAKLTPSQEARNCSRGLFPSHVAVMRVIVLFGRNRVDEILPHVSEDLLSDIRDAVLKAPTTDEGWASVRLIIGGTFREGYDQEAAEQDWRAAYRAGVESLERFFQLRGGLEGKTC